MAALCFWSPKRIPSTIIKYMYSVPENEITSTCYLLVTICKKIALQAIKYIHDALKYDELCRRDRMKLLKFLFEFFVIGGGLKDDAQDQLITVAKDILWDCSGDEFMLVFKFLKQSKLSKSTVGQQHLIFLSLRKAGLPKTLDLDSDKGFAADRMLICIQEILPYFGTTISCDPLIKYLCIEVLPQWKEIRVKCGAYYQNKFLKTLTQLCLNGEPIDHPAKPMAPVLDVLRQVMPLSKDYSFRVSLSNVECILYIVHYLACQKSEISFTTTIRDDLTKRLNFFLKNMKSYKRVLMLQIRGSKSNGSDNDDDDINTTIDLMLDNILRMIKDLLLSPMIFHCSVIPSFMQVVKRNKSRKRIITELNTLINSKRSRLENSG